MIDITCTFTAPLWLYQGEKAAWHFVSLPQTEAERIRFFIGSDHARGFGSVRVLVSIGRSTWKTSIFPDSKRQSYILPIKKAVRDQETITVNDMVMVQLQVENSH